MKTILIGTRGSDLALWQANFISAKLEASGFACKRKIIKTQGDKIQNLGFDKMEGKGFFTKEIEDALVKKEIDIAVHSFKDLETNSRKGLVVAAVTERQDPSETLLIRKEKVEIKNMFGLSSKAVVGTSSARRKSQLLQFLPDVRLKDLRGNVPTRIKKLRAGEYDAILIATAGIKRLDIDVSDLHVIELNAKEFIPAPAQGVLAVQARSKDKKLIEKLRAINDEQTERTSYIERKILNLFEGGCHLPLGVYCEYQEDEELYKIWVSKSKKWNKIPVRYYYESKKYDGIPERVVEKLNGIQPGSVFITRNIHATDVFKTTLTANGYKVYGNALIETRKVPIIKLPDTEWIFFSSRNAVSFFFEQVKPGDGKKYAAIGKGTALELRRFGKRADFIGYSNDTKLTAKQFASMAGNRKILFPQARGSIRTVQQQFPNKNNFINLTVYETIEHPDVKIPNVAIIVFTSPSNVDAYFEKNKINAAEQKVVAMGDATANALRKRGVNPNKMPVSFDDVGLVQAVFSL